MSGTDSALQPQSGRHSVAQGEAKRTLGLRVLGVRTSPKGATFENRAMLRHLPMVIGVKWNGSADVSPWANHDTRIACPSTASRCWMAPFGTASLADYLQLLHWPQFSIGTAGDRARTRQAQFQMASHHSLSVSGSPARDGDSSSRASAASSAAPPAPPPGFYTKARIMPRLMRARSCGIAHAPDTGRPLDGWLDI